MRHARRRGARIAHFHYFHIGALELLGNLTARLFGLKIVGTVHDVEALKPGSTSSVMSKLAYAMCDMLIVHNAISQKELVSRFGIAQDRVVVVPHGSYVGLTQPRIDKRMARERLGLPLDEKIILFFGQIKRVKGLDILLEAFARALPELGRARLVIAGKVWKDNVSRYQKQIEDRGVSQSVTLDVRYIPDEEAAVLYSAADLVVLPYRKIYQSGVLLMAMSYGVPVLASDLPGMKEVIRDNENGFLFPAEDPSALSSRLVELLAGAKDLDAVAHQGLREMETKYNWSAIGAQLASLYDKVLTSR